MSTVTEPTVAKQAPAGPSNRRWWVAGLLSFGMVNAYFDRVCLSIALPLMVTTVEMTPTQQGIALGAFFWSYTLLQVPSGILVDRFGVRTPYIWGYLLWSFASAGTALTTTLAYLIVVRLLLGVGESVVTPCSMRYIRMHFEEEERGRAVGIYMTGTKIGPAIGFPLAGYLVHAFGWEIMFLVMGLGGLIFLIPWMAWVKKDDIAALTQKEREALVDSQSQQDSSKMQSISGREIILNRVMWGVILGTFCYMYFVYYAMTWMPIYFNKRFGMSITEMSWYPGVSFGGMAVMIWVGGWLADLFIRRGHDPINVRKFFTILGFAFAATQTIGAFTDNPEVMKFFAVASLCGLGFATANYWALTQTLIPGGSIAMVVGIQNTAANLAGIVAPTLTGWLIDQTGSFDAPIKAVGFWLVLGIAGYLLLVRRKYAPKPRQAR